jgi:tetratricopeptide (TPR) repeat protein
VKSLVVILIAAAAGRTSTSSEAAKLTSQAEQLYLQTRYAEAEPIFRQAVDAWTALGPSAQRNRALAMSDFGSLLRAMGRYPEAEQMLTDSLRDLEPGVDASRTLWNLATLYRSTGDLSKAESCAIKAADMVEGRERVAPRLVLASIYTEQRRYSEAEEILAWAEEGADDALRVAIYNNVGAIALTTGKYSRAEEFARKAIELGQKVLPEHHPAVAAAWNSLGQARRFQNDYLEAERAYRQSMELWERAVGSNHPNVARVMMNLGALYHERGREPGAEKLYRRTASIFEATYGRDHYLTLVARNELADVLRAQRRFTEAEKLSAATLASLERSLPAGDARVTQALKNRWQLLYDSGRAREAEALATRIRLSAASAAIPDSGADRAADGISGALLSK